MEAHLLVRLAYLGAALVVLVVCAIPPLRSRFLDYGARTASPTHKDKAPRGQGLLDGVAGLRVPHSWFTSFYVVSVFCSLFWASQIVLKGTVYEAVARNAPEGNASMSVRQVMAVWALMLAQGSRRLYECLSLSKPSKSEMWFGHWVIGILFYVETSMAVWVEGIPSLQQHTFSTKDIAFRAPDPRTFFATLLFLFASGVQHDCHSYLASLKDRKLDAQSKASTSGYRMPDHPAFNLCLTPHYLAECLIYVALSILAAPRGASINWTLASGLVFVVVNLGVTASGTKEWYGRTFGPEAVKGRARMIPFVY